MITPNMLTIARVVMAILACAILVSSNEVQALGFSFLLFLAACFTDWWDGHLARTKGLITDFGKIADPIADKVLVLGLLFSFSYLKVYSVWWVIPIFIREAVVTWIRTQNILRGKILAAEYSGKVKTVVQFATVGLAFLLVWAFRANASGVVPALSIVVHIFLFIANVLTLFSGYLLLKQNIR